MKIESIREALKIKAQNLNVAPVAPVQEQATPVLTARPHQNAQQVSVPHAVVVPMTKATETSVQPAHVEDPKPTRKPATTRGTKGKGKSIQLSDIEAIIAEHLRPGIDYTTLPRCGNKPVLLKGGAEHLASVLNLRTTSEVINSVQVLEKNFILYEIATTVYDATGNILAVGLGSCNTLESRYIKQGVANSLNTVLKMARKRSYVDGILSATGSSRIFTQDIEELAAMGALNERGCEE